MELDIIFRSCSRSTQKRYIDAPKDRLSLACLRSVVASAQQAIRQLADQGLPMRIRLHVLDDHSSESFVQEARRLLSKGGLSDCRLESDGHLDTRFVPMEKPGQGASMRFSCEYAAGNCPGLIYFVEDDYLHAPSAIPEMLEAFHVFSRNLGRDAIISPCDHVNVYKPDEMIPSYIALGSQRHWRTTNGTTSTYLITRALLEKYWDLYLKHSEYDPDDPNNRICEANTINLIYRQEWCFCPMPSLAAHISHPGLESPFFDHRALWEFYDGTTGRGTTGPSNPAAPTP